MSLRLSFCSFILFFSISFFLSGFDENAPYTWGVDVFGNEVPSVPVPYAKPGKSEPDVLPASYFIQNPKDARSKPDPKLEAAICNRYSN